MKIQIKDTIINDEYAVMTKTNDIKKIAKKVAASPGGVVIVKGKDSKILGVVTYEKVINVLLSKKDVSKVKFNDVIQNKIMIINDTDEIDKVISRVHKRKPVATIVVTKKGRLAGYFSRSDLSYAEACQKVVSNILK
jgi:predicted transcriptional regulator